MAFLYLHEQQFASLHELISAQMVISMNNPWEDSFVIASGVNSEYS